MKYGSAFKAREFTLPCLAAFLGLGLFCVVPGIAQAQTDVQSRMNRLENEIETLNRAVYKGEQPPAGSLSASDSANAALDIRINQLETQLRELTGQIEQQGYDIRMLKEQAATPAVPQANTVTQMGRPFGTSPLTGSVYGDTPASTPPAVYGDGGMQQISPPQPTPAIAAPYTANPNSTGQLGTLSQSATGVYTPPSSDDPAAVYETAFALVKDGSYAQAEIGLTDFLTRFPDHTLAPNAKYWLGETYYVRKDYPQAIRVFADAYKQAPKGPKGPDNLLKLGLSLAGAGNTTDACIALNQLQTEYGGTANPVIDRAGKEMATIGCQ